MNSLEKYSNTAVLFSISSKIENCLKCECGCVRVRVGGCVGVGGVAVGVGVWVSVCVRERYLCRFLNLKNPLILLGLCTQLQSKKTKTMTK